MKKTKPPFISQKDWDEVDSPPLTAAMLKKMRPAREVEPKLVEAYRRGELRYRGQRGRQKKPTKRLVSIRLSQDVLRHFKATGAGWQTRLDAALRLLIGAEK